MTVREWESKDIRNVIQSGQHPALGELLGEVEPLNERLSTEAHVYLWFVGD